MRKLISVSAEVSDRLDSFKTIENPSYDAVLKALLNIENVRKSGPRYKYPFHSLKVGEMMTISIPTKCNGEVDERAQRNLYYAILRYRKEGINLSHECIGSENRIRRLE